MEAKLKMIKKIKPLIEQVKIFFTDSRQAWIQVVQANPDSGDINRNLLIPMLVAAAFTQFWGVIFQTGFSETIAAISTAFAHVAATYIGIRLTAWLMSKLSRTFETDLDADRALQLISYSMIPYLAVNIVIGLHPSSMYFMKLLYLYIFYLVWQGSEIIFGIDDNRRPGFVLISTMLLLAIIQAVLTILIRILPIEVIRIA